MCEFNPGNDRLFAYKENVGTSIRHFGLLKKKCNKTSEVNEIYDFEVKNEIHGLLDILEMKITMLLFVEFHYITEGALKMYGIR